ncbi:MAG: hypothetical protein JO174_00215 [Herbaspirillum sp.]|nr:hypothetical protein [Herbaspirillum sp.]
MPGHNVKIPKVFPNAVEKGFAWILKARSFSSESLEKDFLLKALNFFQDCPIKQSTEVETPEAHG